MRDITELRNYVLEVNSQLDERKQASKLVQDTVLLVAKTADEASTDSELLSLTDKLRFALHTSRLALLDEESLELLQDTLDALSSRSPKQVAKCIDKCVKMARIFKTDPKNVKPGPSLERQRSNGRSTGL